MNLELSEQARAFVKSKMETGHFSDEGAAVSYYLEALQGWERRKADVRARVEEGVRAADEGRGTMISSLEEARAHMDKLIEEAEAERQARAAR